MSDHLTREDIQDIVDALRSKAVEKRLAARWVLGVAATILTLVLTAQAVNQGRMSEDLAIVKNEVKHINAAIEDKMGDRFTDTDAKAMTALYGMRFDSINHDIETLEARVAALENR